MSLWLHSDEAQHLASWKDGWVENWGSSSTRREHRLGLRVHYGSDLPEVDATVTSLSVPWGCSPHRVQASPRSHLPGQTICEAGYQG